MIDPEDIFDDEDEDAREERLAIMEFSASESEEQNEQDESEEETPVTQSEVDGFLKQLEDARKILQAKGKTAGLCSACYDTGKLLMENDEGYTGIQYKVDNEIPVLIKCTHGVATDNDLPF